MDGLDYEELAKNWQCIDYHDQDVGGVLFCDCICHIPIGGAYPNGGTTSCEHCELIG